jgi:hypothetical protein
MEVKNIASLVRELAISVTLVILLPLLIRYGVRLFFAIDFHVLPLIGFGFVALGCLLKDSGLSISFMCLGPLMLVSEYSSWHQLTYYDDLIRFLICLAVLLCLSVSLLRWDRLKYRAI